jgi:hypothetical protein
MDLAFRAKHPDLAPELNLFMRDEKEKWGELFTELFKVNSLSKFVAKHLIIVIDD